MLELGCADERALWYYLLTVSFGEVQVKIDWLATASEPRGVCERRGLPSISILLLTSTASCMNNKWHMRSASRL